MDSNNQEDKATITIENANEAERKNMRDPRKNRNAIATVNSNESIETLEAGVNRRIGELSKTIKHNEAGG